jgi:ParB/RepB/Spo0J family partition protein
LTLRLSDIEVTDRARKDNALDEDFVESIREKGVVQPVTVARTGKGYRLLAGGRRFAASLQLGTATIPCHVLDQATDLDDKEIEFIENALRKDLKWQERLKLVVDIHQLMIDKYGPKGSQTATAKFMDKSVGGINRVLQLASHCKTFPILLECGTEDEAVKKARKIVEGALVMQMSRAHKSAAAAAGMGEQELSEVFEASDDEIAEVGDLEDAAESGLKPGEGFRDDQYILSARNAGNHYRVGDAFEELQSMITDGLTPPIKLCEVDPPYGIDLKNQKKGEISRELDIYEEIPRERYAEWTGQLVSLLDEVLPKDCRIIYWYAQEWYSTIVEAFKEVGWDYDPIPCIWNKGSGQTNAPDLYLARTYETFLVATKGDGVPIAERGRSNVFNFPPVPAARKYHPTQKPLDLMDELLRTFGWPGAILLCPFLGSGVTLRSAYRRGMLPFGFELNESNKGPFLAALEDDIQNYKVNLKPTDVKGTDIPF